MSKSDEKGVIAKKENFTVEVKYSDEAIEKKLIRFTVTKGVNFEITADELIALLVNQVNQETLAPTFVETEKINVVQVMRQLRCTLEQDMKAGQEIALNYVHPYPLEYALLEEAYKIAKIDGKHGTMELTKEFIEEVKAKLQPEMEKFTQRFYESYKQLDLKKDAS